MKWTKRSPKKTGFYWVNDFRKDGITPRKGYPKVVKVELDDRHSVGWVPKGTLMAKGIWSSATNPGIYDLKWAGPIKPPTE